MALYTAPPGSENPSSAFLAGQAHGAALAVQHHLAGGSKPAAVKAPRPAAPTGGGNTLDELLAQAQGIAQAQTNQQIQAIRGQQNQYTQQGQQQEQQILAASQAAAKLIAGLNLGGQTADSYNTAAQNIAGLAKGFSGQTQTDASNAANLVQQQLAGLGAPSNSAQTATGQTSNPSALGNVLYGLGGWVPGNLLETVGQAQAGAQRELPLQSLAYGQQMGLGALNAARQNAAALTPNIVNAQSNEPSLYQSILSSLQSQATNQALANSLIGSRSVSGQVARQNANTNAFRAQTTAGYDAAKLAKANAPKPPKPASPATIKSWNTISDNNRNGKTLNRVVKDPTTNQETVQSFTVPNTQKTYQQNIADLIANGVPRVRAVAIANSDYAPGDLGRPYTPAQQQQLANTAALKVVHGVTNPATGKPFTVKDAVTAGKKVGIPPKAITASVRAATRQRAASRAAALRASGGAPIRWNGTAWVPAT